MMFIKGRRNRIHVAIIVLLSLISMLFFQNCGGGIESQASVANSSNGGLSAPNPTPNPNPNNPPPPPPPPPPPGPTPLPAVPLSLKEGYCTSFLNSGDKSTVQVSSDTTFVVSLNSANGTGAQNGIGLEEPANNSAGNSIPLNIQTRIVNANKALTDVATRSTVDTSGQYQAETFSCQFETQVLTSLHSTDATGANGVNFTSAVAVDPNNTTTYGRDIYTMTSRPAIMTIANNSTNLAVSAPAISNSIVSTVTGSAFVNLDRANAGYRCVQGHAWLRIAAQTSVRVVGNQNFKSTRPASDFTASEFAYARVNLNNRCWNETKLAQNNTPVRISRYGSFVSASANWIAVASEKDNGNDNGTTVNETGTVTVFKRNAGGSWDRCGELTVPNAVANQATTSVAISEDGNGLPRLAVGNANADSGAGSVAIFYNSTGNCTQTSFQYIERLYPQSAASTNSNQQFGFAVAMNNSTLAVGAPGANGLQGVVYVFDCAAGTCNSPYYFGHGRGQVAGLDLIQPGFGMRLALSSANRLAIGAPQHFGVEAQGDGFVQVRDLTASAATLVANMGPTDVPGSGVEPRSGMRYGDSVAVIGTRLIVGAPYKNAGGTVGRGGIYYYSNFPSSNTPTTNMNNPNNTGSEFFGRSVGLTNRGYLVGADGRNTNEGRVVHYIGGTTTATFSLFAQDKESPTTTFGYSLVTLGAETPALTDDEVVVGAPTKPDGVVGGGAAYHYRIRGMLDGQAR